MENKLIILVGYGTESKTFSRARLVWERLLEQHDDVEIFFNSASAAKKNEWLEWKNADFVSHVYSDNSHIKSEYDETAQWTLDQLSTQLKRELIALNYLRLSNSKPFWVFLTSVTSIISIKRLVSYISNAKCENFLAGHLMSGSTVSADFDFTILSGAGTLISSDLVALLLDRQHQIPKNIYNDVWLSAILKDIPRKNLPRFDFLDAERFDASTFNDVLSKTAEAFNSGHYHFRVKSHKLIGKGRENVDPKMLHLILDTILALES